MFLWRQSPCSERADTFEIATCEKHNSSQDELMEKIVSQDSWDC